MRVCSACSCGNSTLFPYGGQECMHVSPYPSGKRWKRPQRSRLRERKGQDSHLIHHSLCSVRLLIQTQTYTPAIRSSLWTGLHRQPAVVRESENAPEEISSRRLSFMMCLTSTRYRQLMDLCISVFLSRSFLPLIVKYSQSFPSKVIGSIKPGDLSQS